MLAASLCLTLMISADPPKEKELSEAARKELKKLEGKWRITKVVFNGKAKPGDDGFFEFKGRRVIGLEGGEVEDYFEVVILDPATWPTILDLKALVDMGSLMKGTVYESIYKVDGDDLSLAIYLGTGKKRPDKFVSEKDSNVIVITLKREKK
jgi:uncharacterized protein (TIGR03067 family)